MSRKELFLLGSMKTQITGSKLPSRGDVLRVLFYNMRKVNLKLNESASLVIDECLVFWRKTRIPTHDRSYCVKKCKMLCEVLRGLEKHRNRNSIKSKQDEKDFQDSIDDLFDIAHLKAIDMIKIKEDKEFLHMQRKKGRQGCMTGIDMKLTISEKRKAERVEKELQRQQKISRASGSGKQFSTIVCGSL